MLEIEAVGLPKTPEGLMLNFPSLIFKTQNLMTDDLQNLESDD